MYAVKKMLISGQKIYISFMDLENVFWNLTFPTKLE